MKKIIFGLSTIAIVATIAIGATGAFFSDSEEIVGNTFTTGEIDIEIRGSGSTPITLTGMVPDVWSGQYEYEVYNLANSIPVKYRFFDRKDSESPAGFYNKLNVIVRHTYAGTPDPANWPIVYQGPLKNLLIESPADAIVGTLGTGITHVYYMEFQLDASAGNTLQGGSATFDLMFGATQPSNPGWN
jgi:predicted ribosomally synthesized peptide with SipW-like signal peptide